MDCKGEEVLEQARHVNSLLRESSVFTDFQQAEERLKQNREARETLSRLIEMGGRINIDLREGKELEETAESQLLREELKKHPEVRDYLAAQSAYLELLTRIMERIRKPGKN
jgi:cell fate (sporulation/competence/biofilm development) regulator YlbF (YheA/YmcA/DUF963 family)